MRFKPYSAIFVLALLLACGGFFGADAFAHEQGGEAHPEIADVKAKDVVPVSDDMKMGQHVQHLVKHYDLTVKQFTGDKKGGELLEASQQAVAVFQRKLREQGDWKYGEVYNITVADDGFITNHGIYGQLINSKFNKERKFMDKDGKETGTLTGLINSGADEPVCVPYHYDGKDRVACGIEIKVAESKRTSISGFHHAPEDPDIIAPDCSGLEIAVTAKKVNESQDLNDLRDFVQAVIAKFNETVGRVMQEEFIKGRDESLSGRIELGIRSKAACLQKGDYKDGPIYAFIMQATPDATVIANGNNPSLTGLDFSLKDGDVNVATLIQDVVTDADGNPVDGKGGFIEYNWNKPGDPPNPADWFEKNVVPGDTPKCSYVEVANIFKGIPQAGEFFYIFGSGIYDYSKCSVTDDDGGCAISGASSGYGTALLNLLVSAAVLFSAVFLRKRA